MTTSSTPARPNEPSRLMAEEPPTGNYFVAAYPPFSSWKPSLVHELSTALSQRAPGRPLGLYVHLPFCQKKCDYCYYLSYVRKTATQVDSYLTRLLEELELYKSEPLFKDRSLAFVYFGGGTPSTLDPGQIRYFGRGLDRIISWGSVSEVTFECAPQSVDSEKLIALKQIGVSRLSMGVQSFDDEVLRQNGRVHLASDVAKAFSLIRVADFEILNLDLMVGMIGETRESFEASVRRAIELSPDSITIYQTEIPHNTRLHRELVAGKLPGKPVSWHMKRERLDWGFRELEAAGYTIVSGYTAVKNPDSYRFEYQEHLWRGGDMLGLGVASFSYAAGVHFQNAERLGEYSAQVGKGVLPVRRARRLSREERRVREFVLQLKWGEVDVARFRNKFGKNALAQFTEPLREAEGESFLTSSPSAVKLTRKGLLRVDRLLPWFYLKEHRDVRYT